MPLSPLTSPFILYLAPFFLRCIVAAGVLWLRGSMQALYPSSGATEYGPGRPKDLHKTIWSLLKWNPFERTPPDKCVCVREKEIVCVCCHGFHTFGNHGSPTTAATVSERRKRSGGGGRIQRQPDSSLHLLQHQPGSLPAAPRPHVRNSHVHIWYRSLWLTSCPTNKFDF